MTWCDEKLEELKAKSRSKWTEDDHEAYAYCMNATAPECDYECDPDAYSEWYGKEIF